MQERFIFTKRFRVSHLEIEKRYLVKSDNIEKILENDFIEYSVEKIEQFYLVATIDKTLRYRKVDNRYIKNSKQGSGLVRQEQESDVSKEEYYSAKAQNSGAIIKKLRYKFIIDGYKFELDIFKGALKGLRILEIEFANIEEATNFTMPQILKPLIIKEITNEAIYSNGALSKSNKIPLRADSHHSLEQILQEAKKQKKAKFDVYISEYENAKYALDNTFYRISSSLKLQIELFLQTQDFSYIKGAQKSLLRYRSLLKAFKRYIVSESFEEKLLYIDTLLLLLEPSITLEKSFTQLLECKANFAKSEQNKVLKTLIVLAQKRKVAKDKLLNADLLNKVSHFEKLPLKYKKSIEKPFEYISFKVKEQTLKKIKKAKKQKNRTKLFFLLKRYKHIMQLRSEKFRSKKYKKYKKTLQNEKITNTINRVDAKIAKLFTEICLK